MALFTGNSLWHLILQSDFISWLVLISLLILSIVCWTIFLYKIFINRIKQKQLKEAVALLPQIRTVDELLALHARYANTTAGYFIIRLLKQTEWYLENNTVKGIQGLTAQQASMIESQGFQLVDEIIMQEESLLPFFSTSFAISPLLGLFGTVWGLIQAFIAISEKQSADIAAIAPGIAQALTTTLAGLLVAIPAYIMFHYLSLQTRTIEQQLVQLSERCNAVINRLLVR